MTQNPHYREKFMRADLVEKTDFCLLNYGREYLSSFAVRLDTSDKDGQRLVDYFPISYAEQIPDGYDALVFTVHLRPCAGFFNGSTDVDRLNREATDEFIRLTHERYKTVLGDMFGKEIVGIFVDEPHRGFIFGGDDMRHLPYTEKLFDVFRKIKGYDLAARLPEVYYTQGAFNKTAWEYIEVLQQMFLDNFAKPYHDWCKQHNLILTGHMWEESTLAGQTRLSGSAQRYCKYMEYPVIDVLADRDITYWVAKQVSSVAGQLEKPFVLSELYGSTGWQYSFQNHKNQGDWQAVLGVNLRCHHLSWYTMQGAAKRDYPASIFFQSAWYEQYTYVETYFARLNYIMSVGEPVIDVAVVNPVESVWGMVRGGCFNGMQGVYPDMQKAQADYEGLFKVMTDGGVAFDYVDEDILARHGKVDDGVLCVGAAKYRTIVVSGCINIRGTTLKFLNDFAAAGGKVVVRGVPEYVDGVRKEIDATAFMVTDGMSEIVELVKQTAEVKATYQAGLFSNIRKVGNDYFAVFLNRDTEREMREVEIRWNQPLNVEEWCARTGETLPCNFMRQNDYTIIRTSFAAGGERIFRLTEEVGLQPTSGTKHVRRRIQLPAALQYELSEPNPLVLDCAKYYIDGKAVGEDEILKIDIAVRKRFDMPLRGGDECQPWFKAKYQPYSAKTICRLGLEYTIYVQTVPEENVYLALETPEKFAIELNGLQIDSSHSADFYVDKSIRKLLLPAGVLIQGLNVLRLDCDFTDEINLEALYLLGRFGVLLPNVACVEANGGLPCAKIISLPETLDERPLRVQGLPFYGGKIRFFTGIRFADVNVKTQLAFSRVRGACYEADWGGGETEIIAFAPYKSRARRIQGELTFTFCCSRRNTFGPLHYVKRANECRWSGPGRFTSEGARFTSEYVLIDEGLDIPSIMEEPE